MKPKVKKKHKMNIKYAMIKIFKKSKFLRLHLRKRCILTEKTNNCDTFFVSNDSYPHLDRAF
jgi:hypothetical protein